MMATKRLLDASAASVDHELEQARIASQQRQWADYKSGFSAWLYAQPLGEWMVWDNAQGFPQRVPRWELVNQWRAEYYEWLGKQGE